MSNTTTIARPYAKALFRIALDTKQGLEWSTVLHALAQAVLHPDMKRFIANPEVTVAEQVELLLAVVAQAKPRVETSLIERTLTVLARNKRLQALPAIYSQYELLRAAQEKTLVVTVSSFAVLSDEQQQRLTKTLSERLQRQVSLELRLDPSLLGGAIINAGDLVIDGSVRGKLNQLSSSLAA